MFFKDKLRSICDCLDSNFRAMRRPGQNSADIGELAELFVKEFLRDCLSDLFRVFRGGKIVNSQGEESPQIDIVVTTKSTPQIFTDKGIYPIETVVGSIAITSTLTMAKLLADSENFAKLPTVGSAFHIRSDGDEDDPLKDVHKMFEWYDNIPFKCVIGFDGEISQAWADHLD